MLQKSYKLQENLDRTETQRQSVDIVSLATWKYWDASRRITYGIARHVLRRPNKVVVRTKFETRVWKKNEKFNEYLHEKIILSSAHRWRWINWLLNRRNIRSCAATKRVYRDLQTDLLEVFEKMTLRNRPEAKTWDVVPRKHRITKRKYHSRIRKRKRRKKQRSPREAEDVIVVLHQIISWPIAQQRAKIKCFECRECGHYVSQYPKKIFQEERQLRCESFVNS